MHDQKILHRDIKSSNIFLSQGTVPVAKLGDLNVSKVLKQALSRTQAGTPFYASPEVWNDRPYDYKSDIWSLGCVLYELCALQPPFKGADMHSLRKAVSRGEIAPLPKHFSSELDATVRSLLKVSPGLRPDVDQLLRSDSVVAKISATLEEGVRQHTRLLETIRVPRDLRGLKGRLPVAHYGARGHSFDERRRNTLTPIEEFNEKETPRSQKEPEKKPPPHYPRRKISRAASKDGVVRGRRADDKPVRAAPKASLVVQKGKENAAGKRPPMGKKLRNPIAGRQPKAPAAISARK